MELVDESGGVGGELDAEEHDEDIKLFEYGFGAFPALISWLGWLVLKVSK